MLYSMKIDYTVLTNFREKVANLYNDLMLTNEDLLMGFKIRSENHKETQRLLSAINQTLYRAQRLRVGSIASKMMSSYKEALQQRNVEKLIQIMKIQES